MSDTLQIFGKEYTGVTAIKAEDPQGNVLSFVRPDMGPVHKDNGGYLVLNKDGEVAFPTGGFEIGDTDFSHTHILNLVYVLESGMGKTGTFTRTSVLGSGESLIFDTGLSEVNGIFICDTTYPMNNNASKECIVFTIGLFNATDAETGNQSKKWSVWIRGTGAGTAGNTFLNRCSWRVSGGCLYATPDFPGNANYTPFAANREYRWVAW